MSKLKAKIFSGFSKAEIIGMMILAFLILFGPILFTLNTFTGISFKNTGQIGDTIGGITAPFINLLAAFLVYKSFNAQINANKLLSKETNYNYINNLKDDVFDSFNKNILFNDGSSGITDLVKTLDWYLTKTSEPISSGEAHNIGVTISKSGKSIGDLVFFINEVDNSSLEKGQKNYYRGIVIDFMNRHYMLSYKKIVDELLSKPNQIIKENPSYNVLLERVAKNLKILYSKAYRVDE